MIGTIYRYVYKALIITLQPRKSTIGEFGSFPRIELTNMSPEWNPSLSSFSYQEDALMDDQGKLLSSDEEHCPRWFARVSMSNNGSLEKSKRSSEYSRAETLIERVYTNTCALIDISNIIVDDKFRMELQRNVNISHISSINNSQQNNRIGPEELATRWNIVLEISKKAVEVTTQRGIRTVDNPTLSRIFRMNDRKLGYRQLNANILTYTLFSSVKSKQGNVCARSIVIVLGGHAYN